LDAESLEHRHLPSGGGIPGGLDLGQANWFYQNVFLPPASVTPEWNGNVATAAAGTLGADYVAAIIARVNAYRWMAGLPGGITVDPTESAEDQADALMTAANDALSHNPPSSWIDYTAAGALAAASSDLYLGLSGTNAIDGYMIDPGSSNTFVGHRRWILYPPTQTMGVGDIPNQSNSLWVIQPQATPVPSVTMVAWPPAGFVPYSLIPDRWSVQAPYGSDFSQATVSVTENGIPQQVEILSNSGLDYGGQAVVWDMPGVPAPGAGEQVVYNVEIDNATVNGQSESISYTTTTFDPAMTSELEPVPAQVGFVQSSTTVNSVDGTATVEVARSMNSTQQVSVGYATANGTAVAGTNYAAASGILFFAPGQFYQKIVVPILPGTATSRGGSFSIVLFSPSNATVEPIGLMQVTISTASPPIEFNAPQLEVGADSGIPGDGITDDATPAFFGSANPGEVVRLVSGAGIVGTTTSNSVGNYIVSVGQPLPPGHYSFSIFADDSNSAIAASLPVLLTIVPRPATPAAPTLLSADSNGAPGGETTYLASPFLTGATVPNATVWLLSGSGAVINAIGASAAGSYRIQVPSVLSIGQHTYRVQVIDRYGDVSSQSAPRTITVAAKPSKRHMRRVRLHLAKLRRPSH
jgi:hypothetical protein